MVSPESLKVSQSRAEPPALKRNEMELNMASLDLRDFFHPSRDADCSYDVMKIYRMQFPDLYRATDRGEIKTSDGRALRLAGDTLITYKCAVRNIYGKYFTHLDSATQLEIRAVLKTHSHTSQKQINCWDTQSNISPSAAFGLTRAGIGVMPLR